MSNITATPKGLLSIKKVSEIRKYLEHELPRLHNDARRMGKKLTSDDIAALRHLIHDLIRPHITHAQLKQEVRDTVYGYFSMLPNAEPEDYENIPS